MSKGLVLTFAVAACLVGSNVTLAQIILPPPDCVNDCNDNNPCTDDRCTPLGCEHIFNTAPCQDGDACSTNDQCKEGVCRPGAPLVCQPEDACNTYVCDPKAGCLARPKLGAACSDADPCTHGETCSSAGQCGGGTRIICQSDVCNVRTCDGSATCKVSPRVGASCNDNDPCTYGETCSPQGSCGQGTKIECSGDQCNYRTCNGTSTCKVTPRPGRRCEDGNLCTYDDTCTAEGACSGTALVCTSDEAAERTCNGGPTCTVVPRPGASCDDGNPCTQGDVRGEDGVCRGMAYDCPVTACLVSSVCDGKGGCVQVARPDGTDCDADGSRCTPKDVCQAGVCVPDPQPVTCIERDCNTVQCRPDTGDCAYQPTSGGECGLSGCFTAGICNAGVCSGTPKDCSVMDGACLVGVCDAATGACVEAPKTNGTPCSAGGLCSVTAVCAFGNCELEPMACPAASSACKIAACDPGTGQCTEDDRQPGSPCDPGSSCILDGACDESGRCLGSLAPNGAPCTTATGVIGQCLAGTCVSAGGSTFADAGSGPSGSPSSDAGVPGGDGGGCGCRTAGLPRRPVAFAPGLLALLFAGLLRVRARRR